MSGHLTSRLTLVGQVHGIQGLDLTNLDEGHLAILDDPELWAMLEWPERTFREGAYRRIEMIMDICELAYMNGCYTLEGFGFWIKVCDDICEILNNDSISVNVVYQFVNLLIAARRNYIARTGQSGLPEDPISRVVHDIFVACLDPDELAFQEELAGTRRGILGFFTRKMRRTQ